MLRICILYSSIPITSRAIAVLSQIPYFPSGLELFQFTVFIRLFTCLGAYLLFCLASAQEFKLLVFPDDDT